MTTIKQTHLATQNHVTLQKKKIVQNVHIEQTVDWTYTNCVRPELMSDDLRSQTLAINEKSHQLESQGKTVYKMGFGESPFPVPDFLVKSVKDHADKNMYLPVQGLQTLREAFCKWVFAKYNAKYETENIIVAPGSKQNLFGVVGSLSDDVEIIIVTPSWVTYFPLTVIHNKKVTFLHPKPENGFVPTSQEIDELCAEDPERKRLIIMNYPNNPTGISLTIHQAKELAAAFRKNNMIVLSDEIYGELFGSVGTSTSVEHSYGPKVGHVSLSTYCPERVILSNGISKVVGAGGYRLGMMAIPSALSFLLKPMKILASCSYSSVCAPIECATVDVFNGYDVIYDELKKQNVMKIKSKEAKELERYLSKSRRILNPLRNYAYQLFKKAGLKVSRPTAAFYVYPMWSSLKPYLEKHGIYNDKDLCVKLLEKKGVAVLHGSAFKRSSDEFGMRVCLTDFSGKETLDALEALDKQKKLSSENEDDVSIEFLKENCPKMLTGIEKLAEFAIEIQS